MKTLKTNKSNLILIDDEQYEKAVQYQWKDHRGHEGYYYPATKINGKWISFSAVIYGKEKNQTTYFKNGNPYDFSNGNAVICSRAEYAHYSGKTKKNVSSIYENVFLNIKNKMWEVKIIKDKKTTFRRKVFKRG